MKELFHEREWGVWGGVMLRILEQGCQVGEFLHRFPLLAANVGRRSGVGRRRRRNNLPAQFVRGRTEVRIETQKCYGPGTKPSPSPAEVRGRRPEGGGRKSEVRGRRPCGRRSENRGLRAEDDEKVGSRKRSQRTDPPTPRLRRDRSRPAKPELRVGWTCFAELFKLPG